MWALLVLPCPEGLLEARQEPDHLPPPHPLDDLLHAALEHADVHLPGEDVRGGRLEHDPLVLAGTADCLADEGRLADALLADEEEGAGRARAQRGLDGVERRSAPAYELGPRQLVRLDDAADGLEKLRVHEAPPPLADDRKQGRAGNRVAPCPTARPRPAPAPR